MSPETPTFSALLRVREVEFAAAVIDLDTPTAGAGLALIVTTREGTNATSAYLAFVGALALWAWHEMSYFLAVVTGPRPRACPEGASASERFVLGVKASLWHELAIVATALGLPVGLAEAPYGKGGTWSEDGVILFAPHWNGAIYRVPASGGEAARPSRSPIANNSNTAPSDQRSTVRHHRGRIGSPARIGAAPYTISVMKAACSLPSSPVCRV